MTDSTKVNNLQDKLLEAMSILNSALIKSISYDKTILCTIEDDTYKKEGKYTVTDGSVTFDAYSVVTNYSTGNLVYVTVPDGDFENLKMIIGKKTSETQEPFVFTKPFDTIFDLTGNLVEGAKNGGLIANGEKSEYLITAPDELVHWDKNNKVWIPNTPAYDRLGVRADFRSWVKNAVTGNYGLHIILTCETPDVKQDNFKEMSYDLYLDSSEMYGNPYNFESNYEQEKVIDISGCGKIKNIKVTFYQLQDFGDINNELIKLEDEFTTFENLFVDNIYICAGYDLGTYDKEYFEINTSDSLSYKKEYSNNDGVGNQKTITAQWVHLDGDIRIDMSKYQDNAETPKYPYEIRWYKYSVGAAAADEYCGVYWTYLDPEYQNKIKLANDELHNLELELTQRYENNEITQEEYNKANDELLKYYRDLINSYKHLFEVSFYPDVNKQNEKIKAILVYDDNTIYRSSVIPFDNAEEVPSQATIKYLNALEIVADDGTNGNYLIYGQDNSLLSGYDSGIDRTLSLWFNPTGEEDKAVKIQGEDLIDNVTWTLQTDKTMFENMYLNDNIPTYKIKSYFSHGNNNNTIVATYKCNNITYTTEKEFTFGQAGTMGTELTLVIDFEGDQKAVDIGTSSNANIDENVTFVLQLYDKKNGTKLDITEDTVTWSWLMNSKVDGKAWYEVKETTIPTNANNTITVPRSLFEEDNLRILKAKCGSLETYFPVPIRKLNIESPYTHIAGPTLVIYQSNGEPKYNTDKYLLFQNIKEVTEIKWVISAPYLNEVSLPQLSNNLLKPIQMYLEDSPIYGIKAIDTNNNLLWEQPILVIQNRWPNSVVNQWDGNTSLVGDDEKYIVTPAIATGKKNKGDNTFSGVMLGDWGAVKTEDGEGSNQVITSQTGVYGFDHGVITYQLTEDGVAKFGRKGAGQIILDGNSGIIKSNDDEGLKIDLDAGTIKAVNFTLTAGKDDSKIIIDSTAPKEDKKNDRPLMLGSNFSVAWDGTIYSSAGKIGGWLINSNTLYTDGAYKSNGDEAGMGIILKSEGSIKVGSTILIDSAIHEGLISIKVRGEAGTLDYGGIMIKDKNNSELGYLGYVPGAAVTWTGLTVPTYNIGIISASGKGIILNSNTNIGLKCKDGIFIESNEVRFSANADKQFGIYARFA